MVCIRLTVKNYHVIVSRIVIMTPKEQRRKSATRGDVAKLAGVAPTTVSAVLNGRGVELKLAETTRRRVEAAARELRYVPNAAARALRRRGSRTLGLLWAPGFRDTLIAATYRARELGYFVVLLPPAQQDRDPISTVRDAGIAGLLCPTGPGEDFGTELLAAGIPVVWLNPYSDDDHGAADSSIGIDNRAGTGRLAQRLLDRGCTTLAVLGGPDSALPARDAPDRAGPRYQPLLAAYGDRLSSVYASGWNALAGQQAMQQVLASGDRPDAVFASSDQLAAGAISACVRAGLRVPDDIAISGFGNADIGEVLMPTLTTVTWPLAELARSGVRELVRAIDDDADEPVHETLPTELIIRESA